MYEDKAEDDEVVGQTQTVPVTRGLRAAVAARGLPRRPDLAALYQRVVDAQSAPTDFAEVRDVAQSRATAGQRDFLGGLALSTLGGKTMAPTGRALSESGIEAAKSLRANAADIGYYDPETGAFVENPVAARTRADKTALDTIRLAELGETAELNAEQRRYTTDVNAEVRREANEDRRQANADRRQAAADRAEDRRRATADGKPLTPSQLGKVLTAQEHEKTANMLKGEFREDYVARVVPVGEVQNWLSRTVPILSTGTMHEQAEWWRNYNRYVNNPERKEMFGATLTNNEQSTWNASTINPNMDANEVKRALATQAELAQRATERYTKLLMARSRGEQVNTLKDERPYDAVPPRPAETKTLGNKVYEKHGGKWYLRGG